MTNKSNTSKWPEQFGQFNKLIQQRNIRQVVEHFQLTRYFSCTTDLKNYLSSKSVKSIAIDLILCELPYGWYRAFDELGRVYYFDMYNNSAWSHPKQHEMFNNLLKSKGFEISSTIDNIKLNTIDNNENINTTTFKSSNLSTIKKSNKKISQFDHKTNTLYNELHKIVKQQNLQHLDENLEYDDAAIQVTIDIEQSLQSKILCQEILKEHLQVLYKAKEMTLKHMDGIETVSSKLYQLKSSALKRYEKYQVLLSSYSYTDQSNDIIVQNFYINNPYLDQKRVLTLHKHLQQIADIFHSEYIYWHDHYKSMKNNITLGEKILSKIIDFIDQCKLYYKEQELSQVIDKELLATGKTASQLKSEKENVNITLTLKKKFKKIKKSTTAAAAAIANGGRHKNITQIPLEISNFIHNNEIELKIIKTFSKKLNDEDYLQLKNQDYQIKDMRRAIRLLCRNNTSQSIELITLLQDHLKLNCSKIVQIKKQQHMILNEKLSLNKPLEICQQRQLLIQKKVELATNEIEKSIADKAQHMLQIELYKLQQKINEYNTILNTCDNDIDEIQQLNMVYQHQLKFENIQKQFYQSCLKNVPAYTHLIIEQ